ncbi:YaiI/YqxD family protein [Salimicrobium humidisoli]|uniref:UPF0178 protein CKW00_02310 n=1 Tax=Salimicrobium humidisoli TaxID=2029857 RepID=A0ABX4HUF3_9BACI|nr:DUF188 domain-containing protein [Salimicrobium humidisoli]PBB06862.1 hypothetical protein CKW00_02310 [Salimicrobium humidisoli]
MTKFTLTIWVDADSCPVKEEIRSIAYMQTIPVRFVASYDHYSPDLGEEWTFVEKGQDAVDLFILNHVKPGDVVVTQDLSLASLLLERGVYVLTPRGKLIKSFEVESIMHSKYIRMKEKRRGNYGKGPAALTRHDRMLFKERLSDILHERGM